MNKKIILITFVTPSCENIRGTSALPYHLIIGARTNVLYDNETANGNDMFGRCRGSNFYNNENLNENLIIYSFNNNKLSNEEIREVEKELGAMIKIIPLPKWYVWMFKYHLLFLRLFLKYPFVNYIKLSQNFVSEIDAQNPDLIWVMGEELSRIVKQFPSQKRIQIGPDTESLYYYRMLGRRFVMNNPLSFWKNALMYRKYARMEREFCTDKEFIYYAVGEEDIRHLQQLTPNVQAMFLRHPHYEVSPQLKVESGEMKTFHSPKIKLLIAGQYNLYMKQDADLLVEQIYDKANVNDNFLKKHYMLTFLGKGWDKHVERLQKVGYEVNHIRFAPNYIEEICKHDIQITPISIGTGTKGKVLDAFANGLLVIGTPFALENIAAKHNESCVEYTHAKEVIEVLSDIPNNVHKYEEMAAKGNQQVLEYHNRAKIAHELFGL